MNAERLLAEYERVGDAPNAIAKLRAFILDLAVRGKLVAQDTNEDSAALLLKRIELERARLQLIASVEPVGVEEAPFPLPRGWVWSRLGEVCSKTGSGSTPRGGKEVYQSSGIPFLRSQNVHNDGLRLEDVAYISPQVHEKMLGTAVRPGDLLLNITGGSMGRCCRVADDFGEANVSQHVAIVRPAIKGMADFLHHLILAPYFQAFIFDEQTGAGRGGLPKNRMDRIVVGLPPLAEQVRIAAKVDELMALCDQLEKARAERETVRDRLTAATLARLNEPDADTFESDWRFALNMLPAMTTRRDQIAELRKAVLGLAVRGKLVAQDTNEEPAAMPVKATRDEKEQRVAARRQKGSATLSLEEGTAFDCPEGWMLSALGEVSLKITDGAHKTPTYVEKGVPFVSVKDFSSGTLSLKNTRLIPPSEHKLLYKRCDPRRGDILIGRIGTLGKAVVVDTDIEFSLFVSVGLIRVDQRVLSPEFCRLVLNSPFVAKEFERIKVGGGTHTNKLNLGDLHSVALPVPPLAEQHRIVAKVDGLMALCDQLESALAKGEETRGRLLDALLHEALETGAEGGGGGSLNKAGA